MTGLKDKHGFEIPDNSIVYGWYDKAYHFFRVDVRENGSVDMLSCTYGYIHNVKSYLNDSINFLLIGSFEDHKQLLECD